MNRTFKIVSVLVLLSITGNMPAQFTFVGVSGDYGTNIDEFGFSAAGMYSVNQQIDIIPNITYYLPNKVEFLPGDMEDGYIKYTWWAINIDGHYNIKDFGTFMGYGLMGLNFTNITTEDDYTIDVQEFKDKRSETEVGLNIGAGGQLIISNRVGPFAEVKYTLGEAHQFGFRFGVLIRIAQDKVREETEEFELP